MEILFRALKIIVDNNVVGVGLRLSLILLLEKRVINRIIADIIIKYSEYTHSKRTNHKMYLRYTLSKSKPMR